MPVVKSACSANTEALCLQSPAKVNLYLGVTGVRTDGYHELVTVFERVALADELRFEPQDEGLACHCAHPQVPSDERNIAVRAARLVMERSGVSRGLRLTIDKRIPVAAGLGGGSSNAATVLLALNHWWALGLSRETLLAWGRELGADVPFFLADAVFAIGVNRGDVLVPVATRVTFWHVLVSPPIALSTAEVFRAWDALGSAAGRANMSQFAQLLAALVEGRNDEAQGLTWNQLLPAAERLAPAIRDVEEALAQAGAASVHLTGSGPTVVATVPAETDARRIAAHVAQAHPDWQVLVTHTAPSSEQ